MGSHDGIPILAIEIRIDVHIGYYLRRLIEDVQLRLLIDLFIRLDRRRGDGSFRCGRQRGDRRAGAVRWNVGRPKGGLKRGRAAGDWHLTGAGCGGARGRVRQRRGDRPGQEVAGESKCQQSYERDAFIGHRVSPLSIGSSHRVKRQRSRMRCSGPAPMRASVKTGPPWNAGGRPAAQDSSSACGHTGTRGCPRATGSHIDGIPGV